MDAIELVTAFVVRLDELSHHVGTAMSDQTGGDDLWALHRAVIRRHAPRIWQLPSGVHYYVHGIGCRITTAYPERVVVDADLGSQPGSLKFDLWRIQFFVESIHHGWVTRGELTAALETLAARGVIVPIDGDPGWYSTDP
ncbi:DUF6896 domain-containing protein [Planobispora takensis]|uniref:DUF6896 domain-containing protein n=1 Tax=Planobispora takensis TaxID=1367882 RepID=A0A8J3T1K3_9ACTN|nr:hypothetical protein [Planobispora takensis]GII02295.1 hypothetical protein Pta02_43030 [Planobispora takensis]